MLRSTQPAQSFAAGLGLIGFGLLAVGGARIGRALEAGKAAASQAKADEGLAPPAAATAAATGKSGGFFSKRYYEGGFEPTMTKREAGLILGCRETASKERIMDRYRLLIRLNHPDMGGSPMLSAKINEAKNMLFVEAKSDPHYARTVRKPKPEEKAEGEA